MCSAGLQVLNKCNFFSYDKWKVFSICVASLNHNCILIRGISSWRDGRGRELTPTGQGAQGPGWVPRQAGENPEAENPLLSSPLCRRAGSFPITFRGPIRSCPPPAATRSDPAGLLCVSSELREAFLLTSQPVCSPAKWQHCSLTQNN